jgi:hypothetical protein
MSTNKYMSDHYTGTNVSIFIGNQLLTQVLGITYSENQSKRPIYGYNSVYYDAVSNGQYICQGQIFINFIRANYLSHILQMYFFFVNSVKRMVNSGNQSEVMSFLQAQESTNALAQVIRDILDPRLGLGTNNRGPSDFRYRSVDELNSVLGGSRNTNTVDNIYNYNRDERPELDERNIPLFASQSERQRALDQALNTLFEDDQVRSDYIRALTGGVIQSTQRLEGESNIALATIDTIISANRFESVVERNMPLNQADSDLMIFGRPDQFGDAATSPRGIDITVMFGPPYNGIEQNQIINYSKQSSFVLRDCSFIGSSGQIMQDDQPVLETYNFLCRKKETLAQAMTTNSNN